MESLPEDEARPLVFQQKTTKRITTKLKCDIRVASTQILSSLASHELPRTLSTSCLRIKQRLSFWEKVRQGLDGNAGFSQEGLIVTPFAQILASLRNVRNSYIYLSNLSASPRALRRPSTTAPQHVYFNTPREKLSEDQASKLATDTLEELDWCLDQLESIHAHRSVGDMASSKFKRMLSKELNQYKSKAGEQMSQYITDTFLDKLEELEVSPAQVSMSLITGIKKPPLAHTNSLTTLPKYGVETSSEDDLGEVLKDINAWGIDIFEVGRLSENKPLVTVIYTIFRELDIPSTFNIPSKTLYNFLHALESSYHDVPYHCSLHAADVAQTLYYLLQFKAIKTVFSDLEVLAAVFAAAIHDVDHPGLTNQYLVNTGSELAIMYNDESVLEAHSLAVAFKMLQDEAYNIFVNMTKKQCQALRHIVIDMVLATDMSKHMNLLADLKTMVETKKVTGFGVLKLDTYTERIQVLQNAIHCADLSNPTKPLPLYREWVNRITSEFHLQGDREKEEGLDVSPMCDRDKASIEKSQVGFIDYIVHPLWETWADLVQPEAQDITQLLEDNRDWYLSRVPPSPTDRAPAEDLAGAAERISFHITQDDEEEEEEEGPS